MTFSTGDVLSASFMNAAVVGALLGVASSGSTFTNTSGAATTMLTLNVTIPSGLHSSMSVLVVGSIGHLSTTPGVGATCAITNATSLGIDFTTGGSVQGGIVVVKTDLNPAAGARSYLFQLTTTVSTNTVTARQACMFALVV